MSRPVGNPFPATVTILAVLSFICVVPGTVLAQQIAPELYEQLHFRHIGPVGNRVASVAGVPGDPLTYYAGAASGGIWKTVDGGEYWEPVFDDQPDHVTVTRADAHRPVSFSQWQRKD